MNDRAMLADHHWRSDLGQGHRRVQRLLQLLLSARIRIRVVPGALPPLLSTHAGCGGASRGWAAAAGTAAKVLLTHSKCCGSAPDERPF